MEFTADPNKNIIYSAEKIRLSAAILKHLHVLKRTPTKDKLNYFQSVLQVLLGNSINRVADNAYSEAANYIEHPLDLGKSILLRRQSITRAKQSAIWITDTTGTALDIVAAMSKTTALSEGRADLIAVNELAMAFFRGTRFGWGLDENSRKHWYVSDQHDKDDTCDDNQDDGWLSIDEPFQSGDFEPPAHIKCHCLMRLRRSRK